MMHVSLYELHVLLGPITVKQEGTWWFARVLVDGLFVRGSGGTPWEALGNLLTNSQLDETLKRSWPEAYNE